MSGIALLAEVAGDVPVAILAPLWAFAFLVRFAGVSHAIGEGHGTMPWLPRASSWVLFGAGVAFAGTQALVVFGLAVALDAACGFHKRPIKEKAPRPRRSRRGLGWGLALAAYLGLVGVVHFFVSMHVPYGTLLTWSLLSLAFCFALRLALAGPKAAEAALRAPPDHRRHERREKEVPDPVRARAEEVLLRFRARGDAGPFLDFVREAARAADLPASDLQQLETRILSSFARAGTRRDEDVRAALEEVERFLSLRNSRPLEVPSP